MTERERRQRRLLAVRTLEADLAAAHLRLLRSQQEALRQEIQVCHQRMHTVLHIDSAHAEWLLGCAEQELASMHAQRLLQQIELQAEMVATHAAEEQVRRQMREQTKRLCDRTAQDSRIAEERSTQARLDDLFNAARLRRFSK